MIRRRLDAEEISRIHQWMKNSTRYAVFKEGVFLNKDSDISAILGYGTEVEAKVNFQMPSGEYSGPATITLSRRVELLDELHPTSTEEELGRKKLHFESLHIPEEGLDLRVRMSNNRLSDPPKQGLLRGFYQSSIQASPEKVGYLGEVEELLQKYGVKTGRENTSRFSWKELSAILHGMREFEYDWDSGSLNYPPSVFLQKRKGVCVQFARLFCYLVYAAGGISRHLYTQPILNLKSEGRDIFFRTHDLGANHEWAEVYLDDKFRVVDPTFYVNASKTPSEAPFAKRFIDGSNHAYALMFFPSSIALTKEHDGTEQAVRRVNPDSIVQVS